jgi:hypothetical protein
MNTFKSVSIIIFITISFVTAQPTKGSLFLGGTIGIKGASLDTTNFGKDYDGSSSMMRIDIAPRVGYYVSEHLAIGISVGYLWSKGDNTHNDNSVQSTSYKYSLLYIDPYLRFSFYFSDYWGVFTDLLLYYHWGTEEYSLYHGQANYASDTYTYDINEYSLIINPGIAFNLSNRVSLEASISIFTAFRTSLELTAPQLLDSPRTQESYFNFSLDLSTIKLGVNVLL